MARAVKRAVSLNVNTHMGRNHCQTLSITKVSATLVFSRVPLRTCRRQENVQKSARNSSTSKEIRNEDREVKRAGLVHLCHRVGGVRRKWTPYFSRRRLLRHVGLSPGRTLPILTFFHTPLRFISSEMLMAMLPPLPAAAFAESSSGMFIKLPFGNWIWMFWFVLP